MYYAYIRVSTDHQHVENQKHEINTFAQKQGIQINKWIDETISSRKPLQERKLGKLLKKLKKGDVLIATELSRLGRNYGNFTKLFGKRLPNMDTQRKLPLGC